MIKKLLRSIFSVIGALVGYGVFLLAEFLYALTGTNLESILTETQLAGAALCSTVIFGIIFFRMTPSLGKHSVKVAKGIESDLQGVSTNDILSGTFGLIVGLIIAFLVSQIYATIQFFYMGTILTVITYLIMGYLGVIIATKRFKDITGALAVIAKGRGGQSQKSKNKLAEASPKILDTSVIIDGRISDIMKTGFIEGNIVIPEFVLLELQHIADSSDGLKRNRGRRGLDILHKIQEDYGIEIYNTTAEKSLDEIPEVDVKLLKLAQIMNGKVVTNDFNLNKVAGIKGVKVLNINELANTLKPVVLPGEDMKLFLVKEGKESNQAVAYLDDGTMIVVEEGRRYIGQNISVTVTSVLQTSAGRMIFAKPKR
ncbi:PIN/TRAM domain-containing protein [Aminipila butyrica]|uniref:PIN/TRAM domain-containing protein n=1 Tax=Aminipila butyrica TaxID=433296 RepID=A0A858BZB3_9FIRM|nr:PIN/TRAM domain-containing protein [Aminipila butyrica]QIB70260.1 PIN/TRAM domain-containing protein [Aminipila butyrica]